MFSSAAECTVVTGIRGLLTRAGSGRMLGEKDGIRFQKKLKLLFM